MTKKCSVSAVTETTIIKVSRCVARARFERQCLESRLECVDAVACCCLQLLLLLLLKCGDGGGCNILVLGSGGHKAASRSRSLKVMNRSGVLDDAVSAVADALRSSDRDDASDVVASSLRGWS